MPTELDLVGMSRAAASRLVARAAFVAGSCAACAFWKRISKEGISPAYGACHRFPPLASGGWTPTEGRQACGEFTVREHKDGA